MNTYLTLPTPSPRRFRHWTRPALSKAPTRLELTTAHVELVPLQEQRRIEWFAPTLSTCATIRQRHKFQRHIRFLGLCDKIRPKHLQDFFTFPRHSNPRVAGVHALISCSMMLKGAISDDAPKLPHRVFIAHRYLKRQPVGRIHYCEILRGRHVTDRYAALSVKQTSCPS